MTPLVSKAVEQTLMSKAPMFGIDPEDYTWFDIEESTKLTRENLPNDELLQFFRLPFNKTAFVMDDPEGVPLIVYAEQKSSERMRFNVSVPKRKRLMLCEIATMETDDGDTMVGVAVSDVYAPGVDVGPEWVKAISQLVWLALRSYHDQPKLPDAGKFTAASSNRRRIKQGKKPLFDWHTVEVKPVAANHSASSSGGTGIKHRQHEVRGHWCVRKSTGAKYWRNAHKRGDASLGVIFKDYKVKGGQPDNSNQTNP